MDSRNEVSRSIERNTSAARALACVALAAAALYGTAAQASVGEQADQQRDYKLASAQTKTESASAPKFFYVALPLDHGPRAVTTPAMNKKRLEDIRNERLAAAKAAP